jgi:serine protease Do
VVSITISKNVPIIEQCPYNPFSDLPPEFQQFFGDNYPQFYEPCEKGTKLQEVGSGSGFIISADGLVLTNKHVVFDKKASYTVFTNDGKKYDAKVLARDPSQDLAVLKIEGNNFPIVELGDSDSLELGQTAIAIGNALGEFRNTVSVGVISGLARTVTASGGGLTETIQGVIQTDAAINPGNSGGPLINLRGQVIGINTAMASGAENIGFAMPINRAKRAIQSVKTSGEIQAAFLGVRYLMLTPEIAKKQKLPVEAGALLRGTNEGPAIEPNSPAEKAGLLAEDIIVELNGKKINQDNPLGAAISQLGVGETITLKIIRGGKEMTLKATLSKRPE